MVAPGFYRESLTITRHTRILGTPDSSDFAQRVFLEGSVQNTGPHYLELRDLNLIWSRAEPAHGVIVDHPCAMTRIEDVSVAGFRGFGIRQRGGSLTLARVEVSGTRSHDASTVYGPAILLSCGVRARLSDVRLSFNESGGLFMAGTTTQVGGVGLRVGSTRVHPEFDDPMKGAGWGAVHVRDGARLDLRGFRLARNLGYGVQVEGEASAFLEYGWITDTLLLGRHGGDTWGGQNAAAQGGSGGEAWHLISTRADNCGVAVVRDAILLLQGEILVPPVDRFLTPGEAPVRLFEGLYSTTIYRNAIGVCLGRAGSGILDKREGVWITDNGTHAGTLTGEVPAPATPLGL